MYNILLFDLDDTLIDFSSSQRLSLKHIHAQYYFDIDLQHFETIYKKINLELWERVGSGINPLLPREVRLLRFEKLNTYFRNVLCVAEIADAYEFQLQQNINWYENVEQTIQRLHSQGYKLGIITNGIAKAQQKKYEFFKLSQWFDCFVVSDEVGYSKPDPRIFDFALEQLALCKKRVVLSFEKKHILMVGDSLQNDGLGAKNFGIDYCYINNSNIAATTDIPFSFELKSVFELPYVLQKSKSDLLQA